MSRVSYPEITMRILQDDEARTLIIPKISTDTAGSYRSENETCVELWFGLPRGTWYTILTVLISGFLFGYDIGIMSGGIVKLAVDTKGDKENWGVAESDLRKEIIVTMTIWMAAVGAVLSGKINSKIGRKHTLSVGAGLFGISGLAMGISSTWYWLVVGRAIAGIAIGLLSMTAPMYISEQMTTEWRGPINVCNQLTITLGILVASIIAGTFSSTPGGWRWMLGLSVFPALLMLLLLCRVPETFRWLVANHRVQEGREVLAQIRGTKHVDKELEDFLEERENTKEEDQTTGISHLKVMFNCIPVRRALTVGTFLQMFQQLTGINSVIYYSASIIIKAGISDVSSAIWIAAVVNAVNSVFTLLGLYLIERVGRKPLLLGSLFGMFVGLCILSSTFFLIYDLNISSISWAPVMGLVVYCAGFAPGFGPLPWAINSELYPGWCRNTAISITTTTNWICNSIVSMTFLSIANSVGTADAFFIYLLVTLVAIIYFSFFLPETKDVPLEHVQNLFKSSAVFSPCPH